VSLVFLLIALEFAFPLGEAKPGLGDCWPADLFPFFFLLLLLRRDIYGNFCPYKITGYYKNKEAAGPGKYRKAGKKGNYISRHRKSCRSKTFVCIMTPLIES